MKRTLAALLTMTSLFGLSAADAATISGKVTQPNGTTPVGNWPIMLYKFDPKSRYYYYHSSTATDAQGKFSASTNALGSYLVLIGNTGYDSQGDPFSNYGYWMFETGSQYYAETYDDVTVLTPDKAPTPITITDAKQAVTLGKTVKLNPKTAGCTIGGPIKINGMDYNYFYYNYGPTLPTTGGTLAISFKLKNFGASKLTTTVQPVAFLSNSNLNNHRTAYPLSIKNITLPANGTVDVSMNITVPANLMKSNIYENLAFNVGIQTPATGQNPLSNCLDLTLFPVLKPAGTASRADRSYADEPSQSGKVIPLKIAEDGKTVLSWGDPAE